MCSACWRIVARTRWSPWRVWVPLITSSMVSETTVAAVVRRMPQLIASWTMSAAATFRMSVLAADSLAQVRVRQERAACACR